MIGATRNALAAEVARQAKLSGDIGKLQQQISSGKRLTAASDDPVAAARIADINRALADHTVWTKNAEAGATLASTADATLTTTASALNRAKEILVAARSDTSSANDRAAYATELRALAANVADDANATDSSGRRLFPDTAPTPLAVSDTQSIAASETKTKVFDVPLGTASSSIADLLAKAADAIALGDGATMAITGADGVVRTQARGDATASAMDTVDAAIDHIAQVRTDQGFREQGFADAKERLANADTDLTAERSTLEDTDLTYALSEMQAKQLSLQAAQTVFAQSRKSGLFDLLG